MTIVVGGVSPRPVSGFRAAAVVSEIDSRLGLRRRAARRVRRVVAAAPGTRPGWVPTDSMPYGVSEHTATLLFDGRVLVAGGRDVSTVSQFAHIYDPTTSRWSRTGPMWSPRYEHTATLLSDGSVLAAGGFGAAGVVGGWGGDGGDGPAALAYVDRYDPTEGRWHQVADMNAAHAAHTATLLADGTVLVGGGLKSSGFPIGVDRMTSDLVEIYHPDRDTWTVLGEIEALRRYSATATPVRDKILVYGGIFAERYSGTNAEVQSRSDAVLLDPRDPFGPGTDSLDPRDERGWHTATSLPDGTVLIAGGAYEGWSEPHDQPNAISHATLDLRYDPVTHSFAVTAAVAPRRGSHTASALADGTVLVAGGMHVDDGSLSDTSFSTIAAGHTLKDAWLYQPDKLPRGTWTTAGTMIDDRYLHTATPLPDGTVLVTGGIQASTADRTYAVLDTAEVFYPNLPNLSGCNPLFSAKPAVAVASTLRRLGGSS